MMVFRIATKAGQYEGLTTVVDVWSSATGELAKQGCSYSEDSIG